jgi:hypothetical protein
MKSATIKCCIATVLLVVCLVGSVWAQCPMCKMAAESNMKNGGDAGAGLNTGILYLLSMPYLLGGTIAFIWWQQRKKADKMAKQ